MANAKWKGCTFSIDNTAGTLTAITSWINQSAVESAMEILDDSSLADDEYSYVSGMAGATIPFNGWVNTTTEGIFGPLIGNNTSVTKTVSVYNGIRYQTGEVWVNDLKWSGNVGELQVYSGTMTFDGAVTRTSVAPS